ncbi:MAG: PhoU domain-containing protein [Porphyromonas sp.]|nr:PhoU domain-containing protein [Porphyromonas sp.]
MSRIKQQQQQILLKEFELISKNVLLQFAILRKLIDEPQTEELIEEAKNNEIIIDRLEIKIREEVAFTIFKFFPVAEELRRIIAYQDLTTNLERVGDMVLNVVRYVREVDLNRPELHKVRDTVVKMLDDVNLLIRNAILSFTNEQIQVAYEVIEGDDKVDEGYHYIKDLMSEMYSYRELTPEEVYELISIECIAHNLERCGDSATNIAESTIYLIKGRDIRHGEDLNKKQ